MEYDKVVNIPIVKNHGEIRMTCTLKNTMGAEFIDLYCYHRAAETAEFENHINAREYDWYL